MGFSYIYAAAEFQVSLDIAHCMVPLISEPLELLMCNAKCARVCSVCWLLYVASCWSRWNLLSTTTSAPLTKLLHWHLCLDVTYLCAKCDNSMVLPASRALFHCVIGCISVLCWCLWLCGKLWSHFDTGVWLNTPDRSF